MLALVNGAPKVLSLSQVIQYYVKHRQEVIRRRTEWELAKARDRAHIVEGLVRALDLIDQIITLIRASRTVEVARTGLVEQFQFTVIQANAILEMQLQRLVNLERQKLLDEYNELLKQIAYLEDLLANPAKILSLIKEDLKYLKQKYGDARRTRIVPIEADQIGEEDTIPEEEMVITITRNGYIKRVAADTYRIQRRGGRGIIAATSKEEDEIGQMFVATTHHTILFFTDRGRVYRLKAYEVPLGSRQAMGTAVINLIQIEPGEMITATVPTRALGQDGFLVMATCKGEIKRCRLSDFQNLRANGLRAFDIEDDDRLCWVHMTDGTNDIVMATEQGQAVRFPETEVRAMGRAAGGVRGITVERGDRVVGMEVAKPDLDLLVVSENGYGKRTLVKEFPRHHRGGKGVIGMRVTAKTGRIAGLKVVEPDDRLMIITAGGIVIRTSIDEIRRIGRATEGVRVINLDPEDRVASIEAVAKAEASAQAPQARVDINAVLERIDGNGDAALVGADGAEGADEIEDEPETEEE
jgi:DNA gyrase subunit A